MTTTRASVPPASEAKRARIWRWRSLSSAPPMRRRWPARACPGLGVAGMARSIPNHGPRDARLGGMPAADVMQYRGARLLRGARGRAVRVGRAAARRLPRARSCATIPIAPRRRRSRPGGPRSSTAPGPSCATRCAGSTTTTRSKADGGDPRLAARRRARRDGRLAAARGARASSEPSPWHQPQWRSVAGFRVPAEVFLAGPVAQERWIVEHHIVGEDWRDHTRALLAALRGALLRRRAGGPKTGSARWNGCSSRTRRWPRSSTSACGRRTSPPARSCAARWSWPRSPSGIRATRRTGAGPIASCACSSASTATSTSAAARRSSGPRTPSCSSTSSSRSASSRASPTTVPRSSPIGGRATPAVRPSWSSASSQAPISEPGRWFSLVQLLTEAGQLDRASSLLAEIARGEHPEALDPRRVAGPLRRIAAARERLARARRRGLAAAG